MLNQVSLWKASPLFASIYLVNPLDFATRKKVLVAFSQRTRKQLRMNYIFEIAQIFPHQLVFVESGKIYMKAIGEEEVVSLENLTALTDLEI